MTLPEATGATGGAARRYPGRPHVRRALRPLRDDLHAPRGRGRLGEAEVDEALREIRVALLEADVNFVVVRKMVARIKERTVGIETSKSLTPAQQVIKAVHTSWSRPWAARP